MHCSCFRFLCHAGSCLYFHSAHNTHSSSTECKSFEAPCLQSYICSLKVFKMHWREDKSTRRKSCSVEEPFPPLSSELYLTQFEEVQDYLEFPSKSLMTREKNIFHGHLQSRSSFFGNWTNFFFFQDINRT